ncbi:LLM class oxidoreductase [uncultured Kordia sp.]|uniref:LLM class oxidoreductase n=1 Tax=uncultured Kordia sp. TaxID=507699 RepID=UPI0026342019|nr:LLM class oxidoreductase [uncultured Kordia sp.]
MKGFESINKGYNNVFKQNQLSVGLVVPIENYAQSSIPSMENHVERVQLIEKMGFKALWLRDVPFHVPSFGDAGQTYDPFTYLGYLAAKTNEIALGIASIALPLHHPVHVAKSAATVDQLSGGRLILGIASGDRYEEYPAMNIKYDNRSELFREGFQYIRNAQNKFPTIDSKAFGKLEGNIDILPKATSHKIPMLVTGYSQQSLKWNAENADGWMYYPRDTTQQKYRIAEWRKLIAETQTYDKPFLQPLYIDLHENDDFKPQPIHLGFQIGVKYLQGYLEHLQDIGVNHVALNLRFNSNSIEKTLERLANVILPEFQSNMIKKTV